MKERILTCENRKWRETLSLLRKPTLGTGKHVICIIKETGSNSEFD